MALNRDPAPQYISDIANAVDMKDSKAFNAFCMEELKSAKEVILRNHEYIYVDTVIFHAFFVLEYRVDHTDVAISDALVEETFAFLSQCVPLYKQAFRQNERNCLHRCLSLYVCVIAIMRSCVSYLDQSEALRMPKQLSENAIVAILKCTQVLLTTAEWDAITSFLTLLSTPVEEAADAKWATLSFLPVIPPSPAITYLQGDAFRSLFTILIYNLNNLASHASHEVVHSTLCCEELLLLTSGHRHLIPVLPSFLSTLSIQMRVNALMTWRERSLALLLFGHALSLLPNEAPSAEENSIAATVSSWFLKCSSPSSPSPSAITREENESQAAFQTRRVLSELRKQLPPLLTNLLQCCNADGQPNVRLCLLHTCRLLLPASIRYFDSCVTLCCDQLVQGLMDASSVVRHTAQVLTQDVFAQLHDNEKGRFAVLSHVASLLLSLPSFLCMQRESRGLQQIRTVRGYFSMMAVSLPEVIAMNGDTFVQLRSFYDLLKQCLQVDDVVTVAVQVGVLSDGQVGVLSDGQVGVSSGGQTSAQTDVQADTQATALTRTRLYRVVHHYLSDEEASELVLCLTSVFDHCEEVESELGVWLLTDCLEGSMEAAFLLPIVLHHHCTDSPFLHHLVTSLLDALHFTTTQLPNARLLLHSLTVVLLAANAVAAHQSSLLFSLFFYRSLDPHEGVVADALLRLCAHFHVESVPALAAQNSDYLMDAVLIQLRVATTIRTSAVEDQLVFLASVWRDKSGVSRQSDSSTLQNNSLFQFAQDSVRVCTDLLSWKPLLVLRVLAPIVDYLIATVPEETPSFPPTDTVVSRFFKRHTFPAEESAPQPREVELLQTILAPTRFFLASQDVRVQNAVLTVLQKCLDAPAIPRSFPFFSPFLPFLKSLLQTPESALFLSSLRCALAICSLDAYASHEVVKTAVWPSILQTLEACDDWRRELGNAEQATRLREGVIEAVCAYYDGGELFEEVSDEMTEWLEKCVWQSVYAAWLKRICRYNFSYASWVLSSRNETPKNPVLSSVSSKHAKYSIPHNTQLNSSQQTPQ